jgi:hypothetical protein
MTTGLRSIMRIGDERADSMVVTSNSCTSWTLAFLEWCTGSAPTICSEGGGVILAQPESQIMLLLPSEPSRLKGTSVEIFTTSKWLLESFVLVESRTEEETFRRYHGMVTVKAHGQRALVQLVGNSDFGRSAIREAMPYLLKKAIQMITSIGPKPLTSNLEDYSLLSETFCGKNTFTAMRTYIGEHDDKLTDLKDLPLGIDGECLSCRVRFLC